MVRFANYKYHGRNINNLGDHVQIMTIDYLYAEMGIDLSEIVYIDVNELSVYDGPPVLLPVSLPLVNYCEVCFPVKSRRFFSDSPCPKRRFYPRKSTITDSINL